MKPTEEQKMVALLDRKIEVQNKIIETATRELCRLEDLRKYILQPAAPPAG